LQAHSAVLDAVAALGDPSGDRIVFWDDSADALAYLQIGSGLSISGTMLSATGGGGGSSSPRTSTRLSLAAGVPVMTGAVAATGMLRVIPYGGNTIAVYDGSTSWSELAFSETAFDMTAAPGAVASRPHDVFAYNDSGALGIELVPWTNDTTRATALALVCGRYVKSGATTRTLLGTVYLDGSKQARWTPGSAAAGGGAGQLDVWNAHNRVTVVSETVDTTSSWTRAQGTTGPANAAGPGSGLNNRCTFILGLDDEPALCSVFGGGYTTNQFYVVQSALGLDSTTALAGSFSFWGGSASQFGGPAFGAYAGALVGRHFFQRMENALAGAGTCTFFGVSSVYRCAITTTLKM
jgi:hypothetical protein